MLRKRFVLAFAVLTLVIVGAGQVHRLPKPQTESAEGQPAPNFTLRDQSGKDFRLSELRGSRLLLIFYRGYW
jgi:cytochrome oxidase Cu insertion factor (SCO1/SenC/PrrC family)